MIMRKFGFLLAAAGLLLASACGEQEVATETATETAAVETVDTAATGHDHDALMKAAEGTPMPQTVGMAIDDFQLVDHTGKAHRLYYYADAPAVVIMTQGNGCPIVRNAMPAYRAVRDAYAEQGVQFFLLNANLQDTRETIAAEVEDFGFDMPVLVDVNQLVAEELQVTRTAEVFVIDQATSEVVYRGPVDDRLSYQTQKATAEHTYLTDALDALLAGKPVETAQVRAPGCLINLPEQAKRDAHTQISYADTIAPILEEKCVACHQEGGIGPWAMSSYDMVQGYAPMMREVIRTDRMPPWNADPHIGNFLGDKSLSGDEIKTLVHWIEAGAPRGEGEDPLLLVENTAVDWPLGEPDLVITLPAFDVPESGVVDYQHPLLDNPLTEPRWLRASTVKVGSRETVHHILSGFIDRDLKPGEAHERYWKQSIGGYAVGAESNIARPDTGTLVPVGGKFGFQSHYTPIGKPVTDVSQYGLYFYDKDDKPKYVSRLVTIMDFTIDIPPGEGDHKESAYLIFPRDAILQFAFPHAHYRGKSTNLTIEYPDGSQKVLLSLPRYDFNWQRGYEFVEPVEIPAGSKLIANWVFDNSTNNPANPDPEKRIKWGQQSFEEMLYTSLSYRWADETSDDMHDDWQAEILEERMFGMYDDNADDLVQKSELRGRLGMGIASKFDLVDRNGDGALSHEEYAVVIAFLRSQSSGGDD